MCDLPYAIMEVKPNDSFPNEFLFLISTTDQWYEYLIICLQTQISQPSISRGNRRHIRRHAKYYIILNDTLYRHGIDSILQ